MLLWYADLLEEHVKRATVATDRFPQGFETSSEFEASLQRASPGIEIGFASLSPFGVSKLNSQALVFVNRAWRIHGLLSNVHSELDSFERIILRDE